MIKPTVGRIVHYYPSTNEVREINAKGLMAYAGQPLAAIIACVHSDRMVNLAIFDQGGTNFERRSVTLVQDGDDIPVGSYCAWMPYQVGQAVKTERLVIELELATKQACDAIEREIQAKDLNAPRVTATDIEAVIVSEHYFTAAEGIGGAGGEVISIPLDLLTFCVLVLKNGFTVTGESACASPENFNAEVGRKIARENALAKIWPLEGYLLRQRLAEGS